jgi:hypothetical protein
MLLDTINTEAILEEMSHLLTVYETTTPAMRQLQEPVDQHCLDNSEGNDFHSLCCFRHRGEAVSLQLFNELCILPRTNYTVQLSKSALSVYILPSILESVEKEKYIADFATTASNNVAAILQEIIKHHPDGKFIMCFVPTTGGIPISWSAQIIGNLNNQQPYYLPPLPILRQWISCVIELSLSKKNVIANSTSLAPKADQCGKSQLTILWMPMRFI